MAKESVYFDVPNLDNNHDRKKIKTELDSIKGILSVSVSKNNKTVAVDFDNTGVSKSRIKEFLIQMGYEVKMQTKSEHIV